MLERAPDAPVVVSHACCRAVYDIPRNLSDDQLRALRDHDGVLAVMGIPLAVDLEAPSLERVVDHIDHAVEVMGIDHVGIGADFMTQIVESGAEPAFQATSLMPDGMSFADAVPGFSGAGGLPGARAGHGGARVRRRRARGDPRRQPAASHQARTTPGCAPMTAPPTGSARQGGRD